MRFGLPNRSDGAGVTHAWQQAILTLLVKIFNGIVPRAVPPQACPVLEEQEVDGGERKGHMRCLTLGNLGWVASIGNAKCKLGTVRYGTSCHVMFGCSVLRSMDIQPCTSGPRQIRINCTHDKVTDSYFVCRTSVSVVRSTASTRDTVSSRDIRAEDVVRNR